MPAKEFTTSEWSKIRQELNRAPLAYGLPMRSYGSLLVASFNIRKFGQLREPGGDDGRNEETMRFLADVCRQFDLLAIQEVMTNLDGVRRLRELMGSEFGLLVSDIVGTFPGESGNEERLAFIYTRTAMKRGELVTEVTTSRTKLLKTLARSHKELFDYMKSDASAKRLREYYAKTLPEWQREVEQGSKRKRPKEPSFNVSVKPFLQFIRTPFAASFEAHGHPGLERYRFLAVNAHLHFGKKSDRRNEAAALMEWILGKVQSGDSQHVLMMGDLNFDFDNPKTDLQRILKKFDELGGISDQVFVSFPFIFPHPRSFQDHPEGDVFRSNVGLSQTYDQIGIFSSDRRITQRLASTPTGHSPDEQWARPGGPDYGVFDFSDLFSRTLKGKRIRDMRASEAKKFIARFEHKVSDHMPIWFRMPLPQPQEGFSTEV